MKKSCLLILMQLVASCFFACASAPESTEALPTATQIPTEKPTPQVVEFVFEASDPATPAPTSTPAPTDTPEPVYSSAVIGAVGDIMVMPSQVENAYDRSTGTYDFMHSFVGVQAMFSSVDLMCGNLEGAIAGPEIGYSNGTTDNEGKIKFNAPDAFAYNLAAVGFDVVTTANNHAGDCGTQGVINTINTLEAAGLLHTGSFRNKDERNIPLIVDVNGIRIGILATTESINSSANMTGPEKDEMFSRIQHFDKIETDISRAKAAGAEFIIMFAHWDIEYASKPLRETRAYANQLLAAGVDAIIGSHPHVVQPIEYVTVKRSDGSSYTGLVAWSLGNFLANMADESSYGLYLQLKIGKQPDGTVALEEACYMPTYCFDEDVTVELADGSLKNRIVHQVVPAFENRDLIVSYSPLSAKCYRRAGLAREHVLKVCGTETLPVMEDACWIN